MRGKAADLAVGRLKIRITPAYAGKSTSDFAAYRSRSGSPPPMRGKVLDRMTKVECKGITPAYAGKRVYAMIAQDRV